MTAVQLTETERGQIREADAIRTLYIAKIMTKMGYFRGLDTGDVTWVIGRKWSAEAKENPSLLMSDNNLMIGFEFDLIGRQFDYKDTDTVGSLEEQFIAYMDDDAARWGYMTDDYFAGKKHTFIF